MPWLYQWYPDYVRFVQWTVFTFRYFKLFMRRTPWNVVAMKDFIVGNSNKKIVYIDNDSFTKTNDNVQ